MNKVIDFKERNREKAEQLFNEADKYTDKLEEEIRRYETKRKNRCKGTENDFDRITQALKGLQEATEIENEGLEYLRKGT